MRIYVASSWRNAAQPSVVAALRDAGHTVYDFHHPDGPDSTGFAWASVDPSWSTWGDPERTDGRKAFGAGINHPIAVAGYESDMDALTSADCTILLLPSGRSAHLELGYAIGLEQHTAIMFTKGEPFEPELMYRMAEYLTDDVDLLIGWLAARPHRTR